MNQDTVLVERARQGEKAAFRELVERYKKRIYYLSRDLTGNHHDAEDLSQEVFIKAYRSLKDFRGDAQFSSWLYRIAVNTSISQRRKKSYAAMTLHDFIEEDRGDNQDQEHLSTGQNPERSAEAGLMQAHIDAALQRLAPRERSIFVLRHYHDLPLKEIAETLSITVGSVKSLHFRAIKRLRKELSFYREEFGLEDANE
ncbi:MAG: RNA polymerase sigma factor [Candidatus Zhuqueibacterota bacterium]